MIGLVEVAVVTAAIALLYGRSGLFQSRQFQAIWPYISPQRRPVKRASSPGGNGITPAAHVAAKQRRRGLPSFEGNKLYWFLTILAATAVSTWIVTR